MNVVQCRMALAGLGWRPEELAREARVPIEALQRFDRGEVVPPGVYAALRDALHDAGVIFEDEGQMVEGGPGVRLRRALSDEGTRPEELSSANDD
ncbi:MAG: DNA-binding protein [Candidatus Kaistia colombiensis]|nr:MAG: DNA-binding protein [Kaistia sp.]